MKQYQGIHNLDCLTNDCLESKKLMNALLDGDLNELDTAVVTGHLAACGKCSEYYNQLKFIVDTAMTLGEIPMPEDVSMRLNDFLRENMNRTNSCAKK